jgi:hypothetical protein
MRAYLSGILAALLALGAALIYAKGRKDEGQDNEIQDHNEYIATRRRMDEADGRAPRTRRLYRRMAGRYRSGQGRH